MPARRDDRVRARQRAVAGRCPHGKRRDPAGSVRCPPAPSDGSNVRALRCSDASTAAVLLADLDGAAGHKWSWMRLGRGVRQRRRVAAALPCAAGPAQLADDGTGVVCADPNDPAKAVLYSFARDKASPLGIPVATALVVAVGASWACAGVGERRRGVVGTGRAYHRRTGELRSPRRRRCVLPRVAGRRPAVGVYTDDVYTDEAQKQADVRCGRSSSTARRRGGSCRATRSRSTGATTPSGCSPRTAGRRASSTPRAASTSASKASRWSPPRRTAGGWLMLEAAQTGKGARKAVRRQASPADKAGSGCPAGSVRRRAGGTTGGPARAVARSARGPLQGGAGGDRRGRGRRGGLGSGRGAAKNSLQARCCVPETPMPPVPAPNLATCAVACSTEPSPRSLGTPRARPARALERATRSVADDLGPAQRRERAAVLDHLHDYIVAERNQRHRPVPHADLHRRPRRALCDGRRDRSERSPQGSSSASPATTTTRTSTSSRRRRAAAMADRARDLARRRRRGSSRRPCSN